MPTNDYLQILLPRAIDRGRGVIAVRRFEGQLYVKRSNAFVNVTSRKISYSPAWAKVEVSSNIAGREIQRVSGDNGRIELDLVATEQEPFTIRFENNSIDTEVRFTVTLLGFQFGEG